MPQTRFVLRKALELNKKVVVVVNKVDRPAARPDWVIDQTFELFLDLGASDEQCGEGGSQRTGGSRPPQTILGWSLGCKGACNTATLLGFRALKCVCHWHIGHPGIPVWLSTLHTQ